ncbi:MAG: class I SAM-dependent methyltransferase [Terrimicrobiaceae bacterium]
MCLACHPAIDPAKQNAFAEQLLEILNHGATSLLISIGHRTGLFDVMSDGAARTSAELAEEAGLNERYVREWLAGLLVGRIIDTDPVTRKYRLPLEHGRCLSRKSPTDNMAVFAQYLPTLAQAEDRLVECFRHGGGVPYEAYPRFHEVMAEDSGQSVVPMIATGVVELFPGLRERLEAGIDVLDVGCGRGLALMKLAETYPHSRFVGYDLSAEAIQTASEMAGRKHLRNIRFEQKDLTLWEELESFDWITALDAIHDQAKPDVVLAAIHRALRKGGFFLMQDIDASSEPAENINHPIGALLYTVSCMHCMTVSLAQGGMGLGAMWGVQAAETMLRDAGFTDIHIHRFPHDVQNAYFVIRKS